MDEFFDIVNDSDEVIGYDTRKEVHSKGHIHRSVLFYIFDKEHRVFVNQRTMNKEFYPGYWSIVFGGHVHAGETYGDAAIREVEEEAGIIEKPIFITSFQKRFDENDKENVNVYAFITESELKIDPEEIKQGIFMTMKELEEKLGQEKFLPETHGLYEILKKYIIK